MVVLLKAVSPARQAGSRPPSSGERPLSSRMIMLWMRAKAARARSGLPAALEAAVSVTAHRQGRNPPYRADLPVPARP